MGASGFGYAAGAPVRPRRAADARRPGAADAERQASERLQDLSGVALPVEAACNGQSFRNFMLITHRGLSGPAILQISSYWQPGDDLHLDLLPGIDADRLPAANSASRIRPAS